MAAAIVRGVAKQAAFTCVRFCDPSKSAVDTCARLAGRKSGGQCSVADLFRTCTVVVLAVKPQVAVSLLDSVREFLTCEHLVISIMAGLSLTSLRSLLGTNPRIVRVMPNAPLMVGRGASALATEAATSPADVELVRTMFASLGYCAIVPEPLLNAVTGVSGSGPAYVAIIIEALADGGVRQGLPRQLALNLAAHTVAGAAGMVIEGADGRPLHPALLKDMVCSPGGTSIAGVAALEAGAARSAILNAVQAATRRANELGNSKL